MRNNDMRNNDIRNNDERIDNIIQSIRNYDYLLDTAFERNAATITLQKIRGILGMEKAPRGREGCGDCRMVREVAGAWG